MATAPDLGAVSSLLQRAGYARDQQATDFRVWLDGRRVALLDLVGFGRPGPHDMTTATVVCERSAEAAPSQRTRDAAMALAAPLVLTASNGSVVLWASAESTAEPLAAGHVSDSADVIRLLRPDYLLAAKIGQRQLPLFRMPIDHLQAARADRAARLEPLLVGSLTTAADYYGTQSADVEVAHKKAARLVIGALTALVLRDKSDLRELAERELLREVARRFPRNFHWLEDLKAQDRHLLFAVLRELGEWIDYTSLDPATVSQVYESALVADEERAALGIHYTPPGLARRLLAELPVEVVPPEERYVFDPACGSGTLLVAAHDRLRSLQPIEWAERDRHEDLRVHLRGFDVDPFAAEIARLALLLNAMPAGNGWQVDDRNSLVLGDDVDGLRPSIVVANPPWRHVRAGGEAVEFADEFVAASLRLLRPGGLLAFLLPSSWLDSRASSETRILLRSSCELFEAWRLPLHTFPTSNARAVAVLAQKRSGVEGSDGHRLLRVVRPGGLKRFTRSGVADETYILPPDDPSSTGPILVGPLAAASANTEIRLDDIAVVRTGTQPRPGIADGDGSVWYLDSFRDVGTYGVVNEGQLWRVDFPDDFQTARGGALIPVRKVLVSALRLSDGPWCVKTVLDPVGAAARNSVHMVAPRDASDDALFALFAFTASGFFNCWIDEHAVGVNIPTSATRSAPVPFGREFAARLAPQGRAVVAAATRQDQDALIAALHDTEEAVWRGFDSLPDVRAICAKRLSGWEAPEGAMRYEVPEAAESVVREPVMRRFGYIMDVAVGGVRLWVNGLTEESGEWMAIPTRMPGYLLRAGATFDVTEYGEGLEKARYVLQAHSYEKPALVVS